MARGADDDIKSVAARNTPKSLLTKKVQTADISKEELEFLEEEITLKKAYEYLMQMLPGEEKPEESILVEKRQERIKELFPSDSKDMPGWSALHYLAKRQGIIQEDYDVYIPRPHAGLSYTITWGGPEDERVKAHFSENTWQTIPERIERDKNDLIKGFEVRSKEALRLQKEAHKILREAGFDDFSADSPAAKFLAQLGEEVVNGYPYQGQSYPLFRDRVHLLKSWEDSSLLSLMPEGYDIKMEEVPEGPGLIWKATVKRAGKKTFVFSGLTEELVEKEAKAIVKKDKEDALKKLMNRQRRYLERKDIFQGLETDHICYDHYGNLARNFLSDGDLGDLKREDKGDYTFVTGTSSFYFANQDKKKKGDLLLVFLKGKLVRQEGFDDYSEVSGSLSKFFPALRRRNLMKIAEKTRPSRL